MKIFMNKNEKKILPAESKEAILTYFLWFQFTGQLLLHSCLDLRSEERWPQPSRIPHHGNSL